MKHKLDFFYLINSLLLCSSEYNYRIISCCKAKILFFSEVENIDISDWTDQYLKLKKKEFSKEDIKNYYLYLTGSLLHYFAGSPIEERGCIFTETYAFLHFVTAKQRKEVNNG